jgi:hypothetical protein
MCLCVLRKKQRAAVLRRRRQTMVEDLDRIAFFRGLPDATTADFAIMNLMYNLYATIRETARLSQLDVNGNKRKRVKHH